MHIESPSWLPWNSTRQRIWGAACRLPHFKSPPLAFSFLTSLGLFCCFARVYDLSGPRFLTCAGPSVLLCPPPPHSAVTQSFCKARISWTISDSPPCSLKTLLSVDYIYQSRQLSVWVTFHFIDWVLSSRRSETLWSMLTSVTPITQPIIRARNIICYREALLISELQCLW